MKIWCETCKGSGVFRSDLGPIMCDHCNGKGYTENEELERLAIIGEEVEKAFQMTGCKYTDGCIEKVLKIVLNYATSKTDTKQAIIDIADVVDAWVE